MLLRTESSLGPSSGGKDSGSRPWILGLQGCPGGLPNQNCSLNMVGEYRKGDDVRTELISGAPVASNKSYQGPLQGRLSLRKQAPLSTPVRHSKHSPL